MFRASSVHLQEDTIVYMQHMVLSLSMRVREATTNSRREWQYQMLHVYNCILLKMSTWGSKHVEEYNILWINNNQCIKLVINIESIRGARSENIKLILFCRMYFFPSCNYWVVFFGTDQNWNGSNCIELIVAQRKYVEQVRFSISQKKMKWLHST